MTGCGPHRERGGNYKQGLPNLWRQSLCRGSGKGGPDGDSDAVLTSFLVLSSQKVYWKVMIPEGNGAELLPFIISARKGGTKAENCQIDRDGHGGREEERVSGNLGFSCCPQPGFSLPRFPFPSLPPSCTVHFGSLAE